MEILYLWIEDYKNIKKQGFNFSGEYEFEFKPIEYYNIYKGRIDEKKIVLKGELKYNKLEKINDIKFFGDNLSLKAIVGKNGCGKSSLLEFLTLFIQYHNLSSIFSEDYSGLRNYRGVLIIKEYGKLKIFENISCFKSVKMKIQGDLVSNIEKQSDISSLESCIYINDAINHSNYEDGLRDVNNIKNYSIPFLIEKNFKDSFKGKNYSLDLENHHRSLIFEAFYLDLTTKIARFLTFKKFKFLEFNNIKYLDIKIDWDYRYKNERNDYYMNDKYSIYSKVDEIFNNYKYNKDLKLFIIFIGVVFREMVFNYHSTKYISIENEKEKKQKELDEIHYKILEYLNGDFKVENIKDISNFCKKKYFFKDFSTVLDRIYDFYENKKILNPLSDRFLLEIDDNSIKFLETLKEDYHFNFIFKFSFYHKNYYDDKFQLSSGEFLLLSIFGRIYDYYSKLEKNSWNRKDIIFILDEINEYFHPEWQRKFIFWFLKELKIIFNHFNIQIIIAIHSPFIVSDIPKENIIFLNKDDNGYCKVVSGVDKKNTFGANIHTLLSDSFFMESTMGEFAKETIENVILYLNGDKNKSKYKDLDLSEIEKIVNIIGEPIIKKELQKMIDRERLKNTNEKVKKIDQIEKQIAKLEKEVEFLKGKND